MTKGTEIRYHVRGGTPLSGTVFIQGAKNAALKMIAASLMAAKGRTVLRNVPPIEDVRRALVLFAFLVSCRSPDAAAPGLDAGERHRRHRCGGSNCGTIRP